MKFKVRILTISVAVGLSAVILSTVAEGSFDATKRLLFKQVAQLTAAKETNSFEYNGVNYNNEYERLLAKDGFIYGMDINWFGSFAQNTVSLGNNNLSGMASVFDPAKFEKDLWNIKALGFNAVNVWMFQDGVGGLLFDDEGLVTGLDKNFLTNTKKMLEIARKIGVDIVPSIQPHGKSHFFFQGLNGESPNEIGYKYLRYYWDDEGRQAYLNNAVKPLCKLLSDYQDVLPIINLTVENGTNMINDMKTGMFYAAEYGSLTWENFVSFVNDLNAEVKAQMPNVMTSVEDVAWFNNSFKYNDVDVDLIGRNGYDNQGKVVDPKELFVEKPVYLGEFNTFEGDDNRSEELKTAARLAFYPNAVEKGYVGGFFFQWDRAEGAELGMFTSATSDNIEALKDFAIPLANTIRDLKYSRNKETVIVDKPTMLYYSAGNTIYFIGSRDVESYTLERKTNGGKWEVVLKNIDPDNDTLVNGIVKCVDATATGGNTYSYRAVAYNSDGDYAISDPSNEAEFFVPEEMLKDAGFEEGEIDVGGWYTLGSDQYPFAVYTSETSRTGDYCLYVNWAEGAGKIGTGNAQWASQWAKDATGLTPGVRYELSYWYKDAVRGDGSLSITVRNKNNANLCWNTIATTEEDDHEWKKAKAQFIAPSDGEVKVVLMGSSTYDLSIKCYLDDFSIKEVR